MRENYLDRIMEAKKDYEVGQVIYFNDGSVKTETNSYAKKMNKIYDTVELEMLVEDFCGATASYSRQYDLDTMEVKLLLGLIYSAKDVNQDFTLKEGAKPVNNIVRYYDAGFNSYADGEQTNDHEYGKYNVTHQGYIHYDKLVRAFTGSGVEFTGPKTFNEFKNAILSGEKFDTNLVAQFKKLDKTKRFGR